MNDRMTIPGRLLLLAEVLAVAVLAIVATGHFGMADGMRITAAFLVAYLVPLLLLKRVNGTSNAAHAVLLVIAVFLSLVAYDCLVTWTTPEDYSLQRPNLIGDARSYYKLALYEYDRSTDYQDVIFPGFSLLILALWKVFGLSVIWPQAMNMMFTMLSVVITGMITRRVLLHRLPLSPRTLVLSGMSLMCLLLFYLTSGVTILKEGATYLSMTMGGFALASMVADDEERHHPWHDIIFFVLACLLMALVRTTYLYFLALGVILMALPHWRRDWVMALCMLGLIAVLMVVGNYFAAYSFYRHAEILDGGWNMQRAFNSDKAYNKSFLGFYFLYSPWHRILLLPVTMAMQFILPFPVPWVPESNEPYLLCFFTRMTYGWYAFGGTALFYCLFVSWRRHDNIGIWPWWPVIVYIGMAYVMGGTMARYMLPFQPFMVPMVLYVLYRVYQGRWRKFYIIWIVTLLLLVFAACYYYHEMR